MKIDFKFINHAKTGLQLGVALCYPIASYRLNDNGVPCGKHKSMYLKLHLLVVTLTWFLRYDFITYANSNSRRERLRRHSQEIVA